MQTLWLVKQVQQNDMNRTQTIRGVFCVAPVSTGRLAPDKRSHTIGNLREAALERTAVSLRPTVMSSTLMWMDNEKIVRAERSGAEGEGR